jgi:hypothetical protein
MAVINVSGLIQSLVIAPDVQNEAIVCVRIGPSPDNTLLVMAKRLPGDPAHEDPYVSSLVNALTVAFVMGREVNLSYDDTNSIITQFAMRN